MSRPTGRCGTVTLTSGQRRQLDELAGELARENPRLARALAGRWYVLRRRLRGRLDSRRRRRLCALGWLTVALTAVAAALLTVGVVLALPVLIALGAAVVVNLPVLFTAARLRPPTV